MSLHIACIMDGNRRYALSKGLPKLEGHRKGVEKLKEVISWGEQAGCKEMTFYAFSTENFKRSEEEKTWLWDLAYKMFSSDAEFKKYKVRFIGNLSLFPEKIQSIAKKLEEETKENEFIVNLCFGYGGREEIVHACNLAIEKGEKVSEESFSKLLYLNSNPDLVIRSGGAIRTSNFLPFQTTYSEWFFLDSFWPALSKEQFLQVIDEFLKRNRNFGK